MLYDVLCCVVFCWMIGCRQVASTGWDGTLQVWDPESGRVLDRHRAHKHFIWCLAYSPDGFKLATGKLISRLYDRGPLNTLMIIHIAIY